MSYGTSDTTVISSTKTEARNLNTIDASAASRDDSSPATFPTTTSPQNRQFHLFLSTTKCTHFITISSVVISSENGKRNMPREMQISEKWILYNQRERKEEEEEEEEDRRERTSWINIVV